MLGRGTAVAQIDGIGAIQAELCLLWFKSGEEGLRNYLDRDQLRIAARSLDGLERVFGGESAHHEREFTVGCHLDGSAIDPLHILGGASTYPLYFHKEFCVGCQDGHRSILRAI
jgi:hypothetical protein